MTAAFPPIDPRPDETAVRNLLTAVGLPTADLIAAYLDSFWGCDDGSGLIGVVGLEIYGGEALLRSLAVAPNQRNQGLGSALLEHAEQTARQRGVRTLYLLTLTIESFFAQRGYVRAVREAVPLVLRQTAEFSLLCPDRAICMTKLLTLASADLSVPDGSARFEDWPSEARYAAERAACRFLTEHRYVALEEASRALDMTLPELWSRIMREASLPDGEPPAFAPFV